MITCRAWVSLLVQVRFAGLHLIKSSTVKLKSTLPLKALVKISIQ